MHEKFEKLSDFSSLCIRRFPSAPAHRARVTTTYLNAKNEHAVDFHPKPPDLNIFEIIWDELNRRVRKTGAIPTILNQLRAKFSSSGITSLRITFSVM